MLFDLYEKIIGILEKIGLNTEDTEFLWVDTVLRRVLKYINF